MSNKSILIKTIYLYVFSGVGLSLIIIGAYTAISFGVKSSQFDKYPLQPYVETQCTYPNIGYPIAKPVIEGAPQPVTPSAEEIKKQETLCLQNQDAQRKIQKTQDLTHSIAMLLLGTLVFLPHWRLARKIS